jgi:hypothetical protein
MATTVDNKEKPAPKVFAVSRLQWLQRLNEEVEFGLAILSVGLGFLGVTVEITGSEYAAVVLNTELEGVDPVAELGDLSVGCDWQGNCGGCFHGATMDHDVSACKNCFNLFCGGV